MKPINYIGLLLGLVLLILYGLLDPNHYLFPKCPFLSWTGWKCPGCGSQRAMHQLLNGHFAATFQYNALFFPALVYALIGYGAAFLFPKKWPGIKERWYGINAAWWALIIIVGYSVLRNVL